MSCEYEYFDCKHIGGKQCNTCLDGSRYIQKKIKQQGIKKTYAKESKRMGSTFELNNHKNVKKMIDSVVSTDMTPNSGAGKVKGDQEITGIINISEELKTQEVERARGHSQFTIKKEWLDKLDRESKSANREFWYLKFAFKNTDSNHYVVIDAEQMHDMIATIIHDRKIAKEADNKIDVETKKRRLAEAETEKLFAEVEYLKAILKKEGISYD